MKELQSFMQDLLTLTNINLISIIISHYIQAWMKISENFVEIVYRIDDMKQADENEAIFQKNLACFFTDFLVQSTHSQSLKIVQALELEPAQTQKQVWTYLGQPLN